MTLSNEEKQKIMNELAGGKPGLIQSESTSKSELDDTSINAEDYNNFEDFAGRPVQSTSLNDENLVEQIREQIRSELSEAKTAG